MLLILAESSLHHALETLTTDEKNTLKEHFCSIVAWV